MQRLLVVLLVLVVPPMASAQTAPFVEDLTSVLVQGAERSIAALWGDYDSDGDPDLLVTDADNGSLDELFRNEGGGIFTALSFQTNDAQSAITNSGSWVDLRVNGQLDLITSSLNDGSLLLNRGSQAGVPNFVHRFTRLDDFDDQRSVDMADYDGDGNLDGVILRRFNKTNLLVRNDLDRGMLLMPSAISERPYDTASSCWGDVNNDGRPDLYVVNTSFDPNELFLNVEGVMERVTDQPTVNDSGRSQSCSWGDYDADGDLDLAVTNVGSPDRLFRFDDGVAVEVALDGGAVTDSFGSAWGDVDNDGDLDLVIARVDEASMLFLNEGDDQFAQIPLGDASYGHGVAATLVDDDLDGDLDLYITYGGFNLLQQNRLYRNATDGVGNWLAVALRRPGEPNRYGVGAHVYAYATIDGVPGVQLRPMHTNSGRQAQAGYRVHFGLADATVVDSLVVDWPQGVSDDRTVLYDVAVNQAITVGDGVVASTDEAPEWGAGPVEALASFEVGEAHPNPSRGSVTIPVRSGGDGEVRAEVLDVLGRRLAVLEGEGAAGATVRLSWDGRDGSGGRAPAGMYVLRVQQGGDEEVVKVTLLD
ncbi:MAG: FG-GAP-like repeat-containing protein [Rubricoccaceae bacterium]|nr:FG-GAP-like repeat-containing protein [Rubricoccaceae bacterium]